MHTKSLRKKSAMVYGSTRGDRKFHCIIGNHRYDFPQEIPSHIYCFVPELGLTKAYPSINPGDAKYKRIYDIRKITDLVGCVLACPAVDTCSVFRL